MTQVDEKHSSPHFNRRQKFCRLAGMLTAALLVVGAMFVMASWRFEARVAQAGGMLVADQQAKSGFVQIRDRFLRSLTGTKDPNFHHIQFIDTPVDDDWLARNRDQIESLSRNTWLTLARTHVTSLGLAELEGISGICAVNLSGTALENDALYSLATLSDLHNLDISRTGITDEGLAELKKFPSLEWVSVDASQATKTGIRHIVAIPTLSAIQIVEPTVQTLKLVPSANRLSLKEAIITTEMLDALKAMDRLTGLSLVACDFGGNSEQDVRSVLSNCQVTVISAQTVAEKEHQGCIY